MDHKKNGMAVVAELNDGISRVTYEKFCIALWNAVTKYHSAASNENVVKMKFSFQWMTRCETLNDEEKCPKYAFIPGLTRGGKHTFAIHIHWVIHGIVGCR